MDLKEKLLHDLKEMKIDNVYIFCRWFSVYYKVNFDLVIETLKELQKEKLISEYIITQYEKEHKEHDSMLRGV